MVTTLIFRGLCFPPVRDPEDQWEDKEQSAPSVIGGQRQLRLWAGTSSVTSVQLSQPLSEEPDKKILNIERDPYIYREEYLSFQTNKSFWEDQPAPVGIQVSTRSFLFTLILVESLWNFVEKVMMLTTINSALCPISGLTLLLQHTYETFHDCQQTPENENFVFTIFLQEPLRTT